MIKKLILLILVLIICGCKSTKITQSESTSFETARHSSDSLYTSQKSDSLAIKIDFKADSIVILYEDQGAADSINLHTELQQLAGDVAHDDNNVIVGNVPAKPTATKHLSIIPYPTQTSFNSVKPKALKIYGVQSSSDTKQSSIANTATQQTNDSSVINHTHVEGIKRSTSYTSTILGIAIPLLILVICAILAIRKLF